MLREPGERRPARRHALLLTGVGLCVLVLVVAVAGLAGGFDELPAEQLPSVPVGEVSEGEPWNVTVVSAGLYTELEPARLQHEDGHWLGVVAEVQVTADESRTDVREALYVRGVDGLTGELEIFGIPEAIAASEVRIISDATRATLVHPGLPERLVFLWERVSDAPPPTEVAVTIVGKTLREDSLSGHLNWLDPAPRSRVTVPLEDNREA